MNKSLTSSVFLSDIDRSVFERILDSLDHVVPQYIPREKYNLLAWEFLHEKEEGFTLYIPEDLQYGELLEIVSHLNQKFELEQEESFQDLVQKTKVWVTTILREHGEDVWWKIIEDMAKKYNISDKMRQTLSEGFMKDYSRSKRAIWEVKKRVWIERRLWQEWDSKKVSEVLADLYGEEFEKTFLRRWVNLLRLGMMTFTHDDFDKIDRKWKKKFWYRIDSLDSEERLLRERMKIDDWKKKLEVVRLRWSNREIEFMEEEATMNILDTLKSYPYQQTKYNHWYQPSKMLKSKRVYCVGFSLIGHAFLKELGIKHVCVSTFDHSYLQVPHRNTAINFDPIIAWTSYSKLEDDADFSKTEDKLLAQVYINTAWEYARGKDFHMALKFYEKALNLSHDISAYAGMWSCYAYMGNIPKAKELYTRVLTEDPSFYIPYSAYSSILLREWKKVAWWMYYVASAKIRWLPPISYQFLFKKAFNRNLRKAFRKHWQIINKYIDAKNYWELFEYLKVLENE